MSSNSDNLYVINNAVKSRQGDIIGYQLENGEIIMKEEAISLARQGAVRGLTGAINKKGGNFFRNLGDELSQTDRNEDIENILRNLPAVYENEIDSQFL
ncbi:MAG: DUF3892 domain-containing protein [Bacillota bacterium]|nr:DUF3892 domain-containing protein [Bacillota bacterium]